MRQSIGLLAIAAGAAVAAPRPAPTDWMSVWEAELSSMESVQAAMGHPATGAPAAPTSTGAAGSDGTSTTVVLNTSTTTSQVTMTATATGTHKPKHSSAGGAPATSGGKQAPSVAVTSTATAAVTTAAPQTTGTPATGGAQAQPSGTDTNTAKVTNPAAFSSGAGSKTVGGNGGSASPEDKYNCYSGSASSYPSMDKWISFDSMWSVNQPLMLKACSNLGYKPDDTEAQVDMIKSAILEVASVSLVDERYILAEIMQESHGCLAVPTTNNGVSNPGIMQDHNGVHWVGNSASAADQYQNIVQQIIDGTQGTIGQTGGGDGLVQGINQYGNIYDAARNYNSGSVNANDLNDGITSTASYVCDIANRMTGWVMAPSGFSSCPK